MRAIHSREYKQILERSHFADGEQTVARFWESLTDLAATLSLKCKGELRADTDARREVVFLDTPTQDLHRNHFLLRRRTPLTAGVPSYTLKFRHPDPFLAAAAEIRNAPEVPHTDRERKFEEDISARGTIPFLSSYSHSCNVTPVPDFSGPATLGAAAALFPGLRTLHSGQDGGALPLETPLGPVGNRSFHELVYRGGKLRLPKDVKAEIALIVWWSPEERALAIVEFSFHYDMPRKTLSPQTAQAACQLHMAVQNALQGTPEFGSKTEFVYSAPESVSCT